MSEGLMTSSVPTSGEGAAIASSNTGVAVLIGGSITTALALVGVYLAAGQQVNLMGYYADFIFPVGALLVGLVASSGYGTLSWLTGTKISGRLLIVMMLLLLGGYWLAQYLEFRVIYPHGAELDDGTPMTFWMYFEALTRSIRFEEHGKVGSEIGTWGYGVRALEVIGFVGGGLITPLVLRQKPYCEPCQRYKRTRDLAWIPAGVVPKKISKKKVDALAIQHAEVLAAAEKAKVALAAILEAARKGDGAALEQEILQHGPIAHRRAVNKLSQRTRVQLRYCARCQAGTIEVALISGQGKYVRRQPLQSLVIDSGLVTQLLQSR